MANQGSYLMFSQKIEMHAALIITRPSLSLLMLTLKSEASEDLTLLSSSVSAVEELENWTRLVFEDMDRDSLPSNRNAQSTNNDTPTNTSGQQSIGLDSTGVNVQDAALLAQFAAAAGNANMGQDYSNMLSQNSYPSLGPTPGFFGNFMHHNSIPPPQLPPLSSLDFPWHSILPPQPQSGMSQYDPRNANSIAHLGTLPFMESQFNSTVQPAATSSRGGNRKASQGQASGSTQHRTSTSPEVEQTEAESQMISDEKRRRNTAASARFRIKKKHRTITLERSVSELTGRADELEREAADLRRENGWLKEIVMLKGTRFAASNLAHRQALSEAAALATGQAGPSTSGSAEADKASDSEEESDSSEEAEKEPAPKGKGKKPPKDTKE
ncbi:hypothetical protein BDN70DRAFT_876039 [Pholiota conissans]|uniref:BZIP domain-containing protein n=1 Tax=Pholiota conissans TaxID=109636 RepID=A0A9P6D3K6_9AGAR|nr:hypothetical protein BDN70DRAFT_876039 [Pholiota conissans]